MFKRLVLITIFIITGISLGYSCAFPPDIIHEFRIDTASGASRVHYTLMSWRNLHPELRKEIESRAGMRLSDENLRAIAEKYLLADIKLYKDDQKLSLSYITGSLRTYSGSQDQYSYVPDTFLEIDFDTDIPLDLTKPRVIRLELEKNIFTDITSLIHAYIYTDIQKDGKEGSYIFDSSDAGYFRYTFLEKSYAIQSSLEETNKKNTFSLTIKPIVDDTIEEVSILPSKKDIQTSLSKWFSAGGYLQGFFQEGNVFFKVIGLLVAVFAGMMHGLLPGHSKSLIGTYMISNPLSRYKEIFILIGSVTFSHTIFIFILATLILALQKGLSAVTGYVIILSSIGYILFGIYFFIRGRQMLRHIGVFQSGFLRSHTSDKDDCECHDHSKKKNNTLKGTLLSGLLAGANPCIDALALFVFAVSIGNALYAFLIIIFFSLGLGMILGIISLLVKSSQRWMMKKSKQFSEKISAYITIYSGILIVIIGSYTLIF